jgi:hypothetical protein
MAKYLKRAVAVDAMRFSTNNDTNSECLNAIVHWLNANKIESNHNGTDVFVSRTTRGTVAVSLGSWVVIDSGWAAILDDDQFNRYYELCDHNWEPVDDSTQEQCLFCGELRPAEIQYFGDEIL